MLLPIKLICPEKDVRNDGMENPRRLTPIRHADLNVKVTGGHGKVLQAFPTGRRNCFQRYITHIA